MMMVLSIAQVSVIERAMREAHVAVKPTKNAKQQVGDSVDLGTQFGVY